jgi:3-oxoacyl-[acyl-carrier-protein] synthase II
MHKRNDVVITGIGLVTPVGNDTQTTWNSLIAGISGTGPQDRFNLGDYLCRSIGFVRGEQAALDKVFAAKHQPRTDRFIHLSVLAGHQAMQDSGYDVNLPAERHRFGVYMGVGVGGLPGIEQAAISATRDGLKRVSPFIIPKIVNNQASGWLSMLWNLHGSIAAIGNACSSSGDSVGMAFRAIRDGYADCMLAGGTEACIIPISIAGFGNMRALSTWDGDPSTASRPFDAKRSGFVMAEGAAVMVLERKDLALARGAKIYAEIVGYGATSDAFHITAMHPEGRGATQAVKMALEDASIKPEQVGYINAHGTGTLMNDPIETLTLKKVFGDHVSPSNSSHALISSTKSMTGHMIGAAGAAEAAITALALKEQVVPPTINLEFPDSTCDLDYVPGMARKHSFEYAISNSFGFGGGNAVLALKKFNG